MSKHSSPEPALFPIRGQVRPEDRAKLLGQQGAVVWLTGLSGSGKSTIAHALEKSLFERGRAAYVLDGDNIRTGLNRDLSFSPEDRRENIRRLAEVGALFADAGLIAVTAFIAPYRADRQAARERIGAGRFVEVFVDAPLEVCRQRDPKGLYADAHRGEVESFTGVSAPYEAPEHPDLHLKTDQQTPEACVAMVLQLLRDRRVIT